MLSRSLARAPRRARSAFSIFERPLTLLCRLRARAAPRARRTAQPLNSDGNILKDYLYCMLGCIENIACLRARAIIGDKITEPWLFFSSSNELDGWCVLDLAPLVDLTLAALTAGAEVRKLCAPRKRAPCVRSRVFDHVFLTPNHLRRLLVASFASRRMARRG